MTTSGSRETTVAPLEVVDLSGSLVWPFRGDPHIALPTGHGGQVRVDPFPGYAHDADLVRERLAMVVEAFPIEHTPTVYLLDREPFERTNGWAMGDTAWNEEADEWQPTRGMIVLAGKRIPLHPAMTRYLVAHEYGHHVEWELAWRRTKPKVDQRVLCEEYAALRGLDPAHYSAEGGRWHDSVVDVFADDFRVLVARAETEFWPHPGIARPEACPAAVDWWLEACGL